MPKYIPLTNVLGESKATQTTVALFNSVRLVKEDVYGKYYLKAVAPYENGVLVERVNL